MSWFRKALCIQQKFEAVGGGFLQYVCTSGNTMRLIDLVLAHFDAPDGWNWDCLSSNPSISIQDIFANPQLPWVWAAVCSNPNLTMQDILAHPDHPWHWDMISSHPNITMQDVLANLDRPWDWSRMSANPNLTLDMVVRHIDKRWVWHLTSRNPGITMDDIFKHETDPTAWELPWDFEAVSENPNVTGDIVLAHSKKPWDWWQLCRNPGIHLQDIMQFPPKNQHWDCAAHNPNIRLKDLLEYNVLQRDSRSDMWYHMASNPNITIEDILSVSPKCWRTKTSRYYYGDDDSPYYGYYYGDDDSPYYGDDNYEAWQRLSQTANICLDDVTSHPELPWNWYSLNTNVNITMHDILDMVHNRVTPTKEYMEDDNPLAWMDWRGLSNNASLTVDDVFANLDLPWNFWWLSANPFQENPQRRLAQRRQHERTAQFKEELIEKAWHPDRFLDWCVEHDM